MTSIIRHISAVSFAVRDTARSLEFYRKLGFAHLYGGDLASFSSLRAGEALVNLALVPDYEGQWWGRAIFRVEDVDAYYQALVKECLTPQLPRDADWGERFFHIADPDGHELSFAELVEEKMA